MTRSLPSNRILPFWIALFYFAAILFPFPAEAGEDSARIYFLQAMKSKQEGNLSAAESLLGKAIEREPGNAEFHFELGNLYIERENLEGARQEFEQVLMISPAHLAAYYNLGLVYKELGRKSEARDQFRRVLELDPANVKAQLQIGYTYQEEGFFEDARQAFEQARETDVTNSEPQHALEDLAQSERDSRDRSQRSLENSLQRNQALFNPPGSQLSQDPSSDKTVLAQAGALLLQQFLSRRSRAQSDQNANDNTA